VRYTRHQTKIIQALELFCGRINQENTLIRCPLGLPIDRKAFFNILKDAVNYLIIVFQLDI
jgi:hypothetical protein